jgi:hypothetical protein
MWGPLDPRWVPMTQTGHGPQTQKLIDLAARTFWYFTCFSRVRVGLQGSEF